MGGKAENKIWTYIIWTGLSGLSGPPKSVDSPVLLLSEDPPSDRELNWIGPLLNKFGLALIIDIRANNPKGPLNVAT